MTYIPGTGPQSIFPAARLALCPEACRCLLHLDFFSLGIFVSVSVQRSAGGFYHHLVLSILSLILSLDLEDRFVDS